MSVQPPCSPAIERQSSAATLNLGELITSLKSSFSVLNVCVLEEHAETLYILFWWWSGVVVARWSRSTKSGPVSTRMGDCVWVQFSVRNIFISVCNQPLRSTQPGHPLVGKCNEYQLKSGDAMRLGVKAGMIRV